jgi:hypothetical protein
MPNRKTIDVEQFKTQINRCLAVGVETTGSYRQGLIDALEYVLDASGNYRGFRYLVKSEVPLNCNPGQVVDSEGKIQTGVLGTDDTRVHYY